MKSITLKLMLSPGTGFISSGKARECVDYTSYKHLSIQHLEHAMFIVVIKSVLVQLGKISAQTINTLCSKEV